MLEGGLKRALATLNQQELHGYAASLHSGQTPRGDGVRRLSANHAATGHIHHVHKFEAKLKYPAAGQTAWPRDRGRRRGLP